MFSVIENRHYSVNFSKCPVVTAHVGSKFLAMQITGLGPKKMFQINGNILEDRLSLKTQRFEDCKRSLLST